MITSFDMERTNYHCQCGCGEEVSIYIEESPESSNKDMLVQNFERSEQIECMGIFYSKEEHIRRKQRKRCLKIKLGRTIQYGTVEGLLRLEAMFIY